MIKTVAIVVLCSDALAIACPLCRDSNAAPQAAGFNSSIEWMLGGTFLVMGWLTLRLWRIVRGTSIQDRR